MKYLLLLTVEGPLDELPDSSDAGTRQTMKRYTVLKQELVDEGVWCGGQALQRASTATGVRRRDGQVIVSDAPFDETTDQLIGYYLVDCADLDDAIAVAARIPAASFGSIEVRPIWDYEALV